MSVERIVEENEFNLEPLEEHDTEGPIDYYDPYEHRIVKNPTTTLQTFVHLLRGYLCTGILAMPMAFANAGYVNGLVLAIIIGTTTLHCMHILIGSMYELCQRKRTPYLTFSEAMKIGFQEGPFFFKCIAPIVSPIVDGFLVLYHLGICSVYIVFIAENFKEFLDKYVTKLDIRIYMSILLVPLLLIYTIRNLQFLAPFSIVANFLFFLGFGIIFYYVFKDLPPISERAPFEKVAELPICLGTTLFTLESIGMILLLEKNMKRPQDYIKPFGILNIGMIFFMILLCVLGFFGYWRYGDDSKGSVTLNLPQDDLLAQHVKLFFAITIWISYALQGYVTVDILWIKYLSKLAHNTGRHKHYELLLRIFIVLLTYIFAMIVPDLYTFVSLVGSFCLSILGIVFPALLQICVQYKTSYGPQRIYLFKNLMLIKLGISAFSFGTYVSIAKIQKLYQVQYFSEVDNSTVIN